MLVPPVNVSQAIWFWKGTDGRVLADDRPEIPPMRPVIVASLLSVPERKSVECLLSKAISGNGFIYLKLTVCLKTPPVSS
jgi:hypothetical protein